MFITLSRVWISLLWVSFGARSVQNPKWISLVFRFPNLHLLFIFSLRLQIYFAINLMSLYQHSLATNPQLIDPYEQKLFHLFSSHENGHGFIDLPGLNNLVQTLQLKERGSLLINLLLKNGTRSGVTFKEFREGLLQVITSEDDGMQRLYSGFGTRVVVTLCLVICCWLVSLSEAYFVLHFLGCWLCISFPSCPIRASRRKKVKTFRRCCSWVFLLMCLCKF